MIKPQPYDDGPSITQGNPFSEVNVDNGPGPRMSAVPQISQGNPYSNANENIEVVEDNPYARPSTHMPSAA
jgi:hypothetical protein